ncbi:MAG: hypothetical protein H7Z73_12425 [Candidatus Saccharibacteria bacterium]|nr:hypothetical protein [Moraxellaceae bacterium]
MGERTYSIITTDPLYSPTPEQQQAALEFFKIVSPLPNARGGYCCHLSKGVQLLGHDYESVTCPLCKTRLVFFEKESGERSEAGHWWDKAYEYEKDYQPIKITMPCCHTKTQIIDLKFDPTLAGFTKFELGALEPNGSEYWENEEECPYYGVWLKPEVIAKFEQLLGSSVSQLWQS